MIKIVEYLRKKRTILWGLFSTSLFIFLIVKANTIMAIAERRCTYCYPSTVNLGTLENGKETQAIVHIKNISNKAVRIVGEETSCSCVFSDQLPLEIGSKETRDIKFNVSIKQTRPIYNQQAILMFDEDGIMKRSMINIKAKVINKSPTLDSKKTVE